MESGGGTMSQPTPPHSKPRNILLVEDDHELRDALSDALSGAGHRLTAVADGVAALQAMRSALPDVVILDLMMPVMDGWQFRVEQRRDPRLAGVPIVAISASASSAAAAIDADLYIRKPVEARTLLRAVDDVLEARARLVAPARNAESERMAALGTLAAGVAHEVNNPLTYVMLHLTHATRLLGTIQGESNRAAVAKIEGLLHGATEGAERIRTVTSGIRAFSRVEELARTPIDVRNVLDAALKLVGADIRQRAKLVTTYAVAPLVLANEGRLAQVFLNLLTNALQAIPEDDDASTHTIRVTTGTDRLGGATIEISDDGEGVPEHLACRIFEPFFSTRPTGHGAGLGLSISQGIVSALGGEIVLRSEVGRGTTFRVSLPAAYSSGTRFVAVATPRRVLVVDHESATGVAVRDAVPVHHDVVAVLSGGEGLAALKRGTFDIVLCDLELPDLSGLDFRRQATDVRPELARAIIFTTRDATSDAAEGARSAGCRVLEKPVVRSALTTLVGEAIPSVKTA